MEKIKCSKCGYNKYKGSLHIHHKNGNSKNNDLDNLEVLCSNCHFEFHHENPIRYKGKRKIPTNKERIYYINEMNRLKRIIEIKDIEMKRLSDLLRPKVFNPFKFCNPLSGEPIIEITSEMQREMTAHVLMR